MSDMDTKIAEQTEEAREQVQQVLAVATGMSTMLIEELDKNPQLVDNLKVICTKYADLMVALVKPIVDYGKAEELKLCQSKWQVVRDTFVDMHKRMPDPQETVMLLAACFNRS